MQAAALAAERVANSLANSPALKAAEQAARQFHESPGMQAAALAAERLVNSPALKAAAEQAAAVVWQLHESPGMQAAVLAAGQLARMPPLPLTPELFSTAYDDERLQAAVRRLEHAADVIAKAPEAERAVEGLAEDAATVREAARPEAQEGVNAWTQFFWFWLFEKVVIDPALETAREEVLPWIVALLVVTAPPPLPPAPDSLTNPGLEPVTMALTLPGNLAEGLPAIVQRAGPVAVYRVVEFFTAQIRNANTRAAYAKAVTQFFTWCDERGLELDQISAVAVAAYVEELQGVYRAPTIKQHLSAIRRLFDWLVVGQVVPWNPTAAVRGPTHIVKKGKDAGPAAQGSAAASRLDRHVGPSGVSATGRCWG